MFALRHKAPGFLAVVACSVSLLAPAPAQESDSLPPAFRHEATRVQGAPGNGDRPTPGPAAERGGSADSPDDAGWSLSDQGLAEVLPAGLSRPAFEEVLRVNFFGTYLFYSKLEQADQDAVYQAYTESGTIETVRTDVMNRSRLRHRLK